MSTPEQVSRLARAIESTLGEVAKISVRRPFLALAAVLAVTAIALTQARNLRLDADLASLLPKSFPSVQDLEKLKAQFGGVGYVAVVAKDAEPETLRQFARDLAPKLAQLPSVSYVDYRRPDEFFRKRALYYLELEDLEDIQDRIEARAHYERKRANPLLVDLENNEPPSLDFSDLEKKYRKGSQKSFARFEKKESYYLDPKAKLGVLLVKPASLASDLNFAKKVIEEVQSVLNEVDLKAYDTNLSVAIAGRYKKKIDQQHAIERDLRLASLIALLLVVFYLALHFRRIIAVLLIMVPLMVGLSWTFGFAALAFDTLNILTGFVGAILIGLGIDHGIHLLGRYEAERALGKDPEEAIRISFTRTGRAVILAAATTTVGFLGLSVSEFRGFREFGIVTALGMLFVVLGYTLTLPALLSLASRIRSHAPHKRAGVFHRYATSIPKWSPAIFWLISIALIAVMTQARGVRFNYDFAALDESEIPSYQLDRVVNRVLGRSQTPIVLLTNQEKDEDLAADAVRKRSEALGPASGVDFVISTRDLVPEEQEEKSEVLSEINTTLQKVDPDPLEEKQQEQLARMLKLTAQPPFTKTDLPQEILRQFEPDNKKSQGGVVLLFPSISLSDGQRIRDLAREVREVPLPDGRTVSAAGEAMVLADILDMVFRESPVAVSFTLALVFLSLWALLGHLGRAVLCFVPALLTICATLGLLPLVGVKLNYLNIVMIPVLFGIAVDAGVHLVVRGTTTLDELEEAIRDTGHAVWGSTLTTAIGFGALLLTRHPGLRSFGQLALVGLLANIVASLIWLVSLLGLRHTRRRRLAGAGLFDSLRARMAGDFATVWGAGYAPVAPGTFGAFAALPCAWILSNLDWPFRVLILGVGTILSIWVAHRYVHGNPKDPDPSEVVLDEFIGVLLALAFVPWTLVWVVAGFGLFRLFDILKPGPVGIIDRSMKNAAGIMLDDVVAGLMAGLLLMGINLIGHSQGLW